MLAAVAWLLLGAPGAGHASTSSSYSTAVCSDGFESGNLGTWSVSGNYRRTANVQRADDRKREGRD